MTANEEPAREADWSKSDLSSADLRDSQKQLIVHSFNLTNIRMLLIEGFTYDELYRLCYDKPNFRPVCNELGPGIGKTGLIDKLIEYAERRKIIEGLLALAEEHNPTQYELHQPYIVTSPTITTPVGGNPRTEDTHANAVLWRLAYAFLRLEQLPSGGWARSLPKWYQTLKGDTEEGRSRGFELRKIGGMNLTCVALLNYTRVLCSVLGKKPEDYLNGQKSPAELELFLSELGQIEKRNRVGQRVAHYIQGRINTEGAIPDQWERNPDTDVHHTLLGIIILLLTYFLSNRYFGVNFYSSLIAMCGYLRRQGRNVRHFNRRYEIYCALKFLEHLLTYDFFKTEDPDVRQALSELPEFLVEIRRQVSEGSVATTYPDTDRNTSGFLMNLLFLWNLNGSDLLESNPNYTTWPLSNIGIDADGFVQCTMGGEQVSDWGHTAEYWWANTHCRKPATDSTQALQMLMTEITNHRVLALTHGVSFSFALGICNPLTPEALQKLDEQVNDALNLGATERNMLSLILWIYHQEYPDDVPLLYKNLDKDQDILKAFSDDRKQLPTISAIKNLFVNKLQPGFYVPTEPQEGLHKRWQEEVEKSIADTKKFFEHEMSDSNTAANEQRLSSKKWFHLFNYLGNETVGSNTWILDVGCGSGAHAIHQFLPKGYRVHFYDCSSRILKQLEAQLDAKDFSKDQYQLTRGEIEDLPDMPRYSPVVLKPSYKLIFADGVLFHISKKLMPKILGHFNKLLSGDGFFFGNFKINDHTLIGIDGRRFEYYANHDEVQRIIEDAGFRVEEVTITKKIASMYGNPYPTQWAHFICSKPVVERKDD